MSVKQSTKEKENAHLKYVCSFIQFLNKLNHMLISTLIKILSQVQLKKNKRMTLRHNPLLIHKYISSKLFLLIVHLEQTCSGLIMNSWQSRENKGVKTPHGDTGTEEMGFCTFFPC